MIIDGKFIEENSIPLNRLMGSVVVTSDYNAGNEALNTRISKIENLTMDSDMALQAFNTKANNHFSTLINDTSTATAPAHSIKAGTVTDAMLASGLKDRVVYTDQNRTITATDTFSGGITFTGTTTYTGAADATDILKVTKGTTTLQATKIQKTLNVTGATTAAGVTATGLTVNGNATITGNLTVSGTTTKVNSTDLQVSDTLISLNEGGAAPTTSSVIGILVGTTGITSAANSVKLARLTYKGDGWYVRNHSTTNNAQTESKIVTEAYLTAQGYAASSNLETSIKNTTSNEYIEKTLKLQLSGFLVKKLFNPMV